MTLIRDPSDGSVRERPKKEIASQANDINPLEPKTGSEEITSGLPITNQNAGYLERLEKSRQWLRQRRSGE